MIKRLSNKIGYTVIELLLVTSIIGVVPISVYMEAMKTAKTAHCVSNLRNVYLAMQMYEMDFDRLPDAKFYPKSPKDDSRSIVNILKGYIDDRNVYICCAMPQELAKKGLTYIWNDTYNNKFLSSVRNRSSEWLMTEMTAADAKIPPPHHGCYNILFFDGHIDTIKENIHLSPTPADLRELLKDKLFVEVKE
jgi:prepilin-type processing-associated H-X9-DG protein